MITENGLEEAIESIKNLEKKFNSPFKSIDKEVGNIAVDNINEKTPVKTGKLRDGNRFESTDKEVILKNDVEYSNIVNSRKEFFFLDDSTIDDIEEIILNNLEENL